MTSTKKKKPLLTAEECGYTLLPVDKDKVKKEPVEE